MNRQNKPCVAMVRIRERYIERLNRLVEAGTLTDSAFRRIIRDFYHQHGRRFPWRETSDPYRVLVSEVMLQQTQTSRVLERYTQFLRKFPTIRVLARAPQREVLSAWEGLGYYRRARNLHRAAQVVCEQYGGDLPSTFEQLRRLPGVGAYTAAAVMVFAWNTPYPMIETNIRAVYIHAFFPRRRSVSDHEILHRVEVSMNRRECREWFYALMDFGVELKRVCPGIHRRSKHHVRQSRFEGSDRQVAAQVLKFIVQAERGVRIATLLRRVQADPLKIEKALTRLIKDGLVARQGARMVRSAGS